MKQYTFADGFKCVASTKQEAIAQHKQCRITASKKKGGPHRRSYTKEEKISRSDKEINLILKSIKDVAKSSGLDTTYTARDDELIHGKNGIKDDNSFSIFAYDDYKSGYVIRGIKGYYNTYMPDLRACECVGQFKVNLKSDTLFTILSAYSRIAKIIAKYTKKDKSAWSKFSTELFKIDLDKLKSNKESARNNAKKEAENYLKIMVAKIKKLGAKIVKSEVYDYENDREDDFEPYVLFSFNNALFGGIAKKEDVELTISSRKVDHSDIGEMEENTINTYDDVKGDLSNLESVLKQSIKSFQESLKSLYESALKDYNNAMKVKI